MTRFESAREIFSRRGIGVEAAMDACPAVITGGADGATCAQYADALIAALR